MEGATKGGGVRLEDEYQPHYAPRRHHYPLRTAARLVRRVNENLPRLDSCLRKEIGIMRF